MKKEIMLITGASRGIGEAIAYQFAEEYELILIARSKQELENITNKINRNGGQAYYYSCDLSNPQEVELTLNSILEAHNFVSNLILNAGVSTNLPLEKNSLENIQSELEINYLSLIRIIKKFLPKMLHEKKGNIIAVGSVMGIFPFPMNSSYAATKAALLSLMKSLRLELAPSGINVGIVLPGLTKTEMTKAFHSFPLPFETPEEVAQTVKLALRNKSAVEISGVINKIAVQIHQAFPFISELILKNGIEFLYPHLNSKL